MLCLPKVKALGIRSVDIYNTDTAGTTMDSGSDINYQVDSQANKVISGRWNVGKKKKTDIFPC